MEIRDGRFEERIINGGSSFYARRGKRASQGFGGSRVMFADAHNEHCIPSARLMPVYSRAS